MTDVTSLYGALLLAGPRSRDVLHKLTTLNLRRCGIQERSARQARLAHVNATILRVEGNSRYLFHPRCAEHVWHAFAATPLALVPLA